MSWTALLDLIAAELGAEVAERVRLRAEREFPSLRVTVPTVYPRPPTDAEIQRVLRECNWCVDLAAKKLGMHRATLYRRLDRNRLNRTARRSNPWD